MLPPFNWTESASTALDEEPKVIATRFGDGYEQRAPAGLNNLAQVWDVVFREVENPIAEEIVAYFRAAGGVESFRWTPLWHTTEIRVVAKRWKRTQNEMPGFSDITVRFEQDFVP